MWQDAGLLGLGKGRKFDCHIAIDDLDIDMGHDVAIMVLRDGKALAKRMDSPDAADELVVPSVRVAGVTGFWSMRVRNPDTPLPNVVINDLRVADCNVTLSDKWCVVTLTPDVARRAHALTGVAGDAKNLLCFPLL